MKTLCDLPWDILRNIASSLSTRERLELVHMNSRLSGFYPETVKKTFSRVATDVDYARFGRVLARREVDSFEAILDPALWTTHTRPHILTKTFMNVLLFPLNAAMLNSRCWIPLHEGLKYGFFWSKDGMLVDCIGTHLVINNPQDSIRYLPILHPGLDVTHVTLYGPIEKLIELYKLPLLVSVHFGTRSHVERLSHRHRVEVSRDCVFSKLNEYLGFDNHELVIPWPLLRRVKSVVCHTITVLLEPEDLGPGGLVLNFPRRWSAQRVELVGRSFMTAATVLGIFQPLFPAATFYLHLAQP
jgi:hypothetical protein